MENGDEVERRYATYIEELADDLSDAVCDLLGSAGFVPSDEGLGLYDWINEVALHWARHAFIETADEARRQGVPLPKPPSANLLDICDCCLAPLDLL